MWGEGVGGKLGGVVVPLQDWFAYSGAVVLNGSRRGFCTPPPQETSGKF